MKRVGLRLALLTALAAALGACADDPEPSQTPLPTTFPTRPAALAAEVAARYTDAWAAGDYTTMHALLAPVDQERYALEAFTALHASFAELARVTGLTASRGRPTVVALPPERRAPDLPPPTPTPLPTVDPSASPSASGSPTPAPTPAPSVDPNVTLLGPLPGVEVPVDLAFATERFGEVELERAMRLVHGPQDWQVRWSPDLLFAELGAGGSLRLDRELGARGEIVTADGVVFATTRDDGVRVYPQEWLAGQTVGYVSEVTAEDLTTLEAQGYRAGDVVGRSGLESGAEAQLRGTPGWTLVAVAADGSESVVLDTEMVPGATLTITLRPEIQLAAQQVISGYSQAATAVVDPASGDVWALASQPTFNPNSMTIGTTLGGQALTPGDTAQIINKAVLGAYPAGSSFKPFTLAAALKTGVATPQSLVTCPPTWQYSGFTFRNYMDHSLPGQVGLAEAMAFSCNTTYMPLAYDVYVAQETALTDLLKEFGFGAATGIGYLIEETGIVPDGDWLAANGRGGYSGFEQVQLAIGQGAFLGTPLQLANAFAAIGNGGRLWQPRILTAATLPDGTVVQEVPPTVTRQISVAPEHMAFVTDTLQAVVTLPYGTGTPAFAGFGIQVAGKSGTAETGTPDPHAWFPAYAPADAPTISVATVLPYIPLGTGGSDAAPLVRRVMSVHFFP